MTWPGTKQDSICTTTRYRTHAIITSLKTKKLTSKMGSKYKDKSLEVPFHRITCQTEILKNLNFCANSARSKT